MKYDVVVVGAGPAGSTAAKFLSEKGIKVLLLDKDKFPRDKPCGGGLTAKVLEEFKYVGENDLIESYSFGGYIYSSSLRYKIEVRKDKPIIAMVLRKKFDHGLVKLAVEKGTTFMDGKAAKDVKALKDKAEVQLSDGTSVESQVVIGADGVWSTVAEKSGLTSGVKTTSISLFQEYPVSPETLDRYFTEKRLCYLHLKIGGIAGYGWVFPKKKHVNIGVGEVRSSVDKSKGKINLKEAYRNYLRILREGKIIPKSLKVGRVKGWALPARPLEKTYADRILLCGDAAGLINPFTGEGIDYAMYSGRIAADVAAEALETGDASANFLSIYERTWKSRFGKDIKLFLRSAKQWGKNSEKIIKLVSKDKKIAEMLLEIAVGNLSIHECKWKLIKRLLYLRLKNPFL